MACLFPHLTPWPARHCPRTAAGTRVRLGGVPPRRSQAPLQPAAPQPAAAPGGGGNSSAAFAPGPASRLLPAAAVVVEVEEHVWEAGPLADALPEGLMPALSLGEVGGCVGGWGLLHAAPCPVRWRHRGCMR